MFRVRATIHGQQRSLSDPNGRPFRTPAEAASLLAYLAGRPFGGDPPERYRHPTWPADWCGADPGADLVAVAPPGADKPNPFDALPEAARHVKLQPPTPRAKPTP